MMTCNGPPYEIQLLGQLTVKRNGELLNCVHKRGMKSQKAMAYLLLKRGRAVSIFELMKTTGIDPSKKSAVNSLKVMIHRTRKLLSDGVAEGSACIVTTPEGYAWNMSFGARVDLFEAEALCERVMSARKLSQLDADEIWTITDLYSREILPEMRGEAWAEMARWNFKRQYGAAMSHVLKLMWKAGAAERIIQTCHRGLANDPMETMFWGHLERAMRVLEEQAATQGDVLTDLARVRREYEAGRNLVRRIANQANERETGKWSL